MTSNPLNDLVGSILLMRILPKLLHCGNIVQSRGTAAAINIEPEKSTLIILRSRYHAIPCIPSPFRLAAERDVVFGDSLEIFEVGNDTISGRTPSLGGP